MERKWYVICTKQKQEKKVSALLTKKGIENYCPFTKAEKKNGTKGVAENKPLFTSYVFVCISKEQIQAVRKMQEVVGMVYWKSKPAVVSSEEVDAIRLMEESYQNIQLKKTIVRPEKKMHVQKENITDYGGSVITIKHKGLIISLPSIGYIMMARTARDTEDVSQKRNVFSDLLPKILNPLYLFGF